MTNVMTGRMKRSGAREEMSEPTRTAGTLPMMIDVVTENSTCPKASAPSAAARVSGHGLGEVGADELVGPEHRVEEEQQHDHQRARADRGHADDEAADHADGDGGERAHDHARR